MLCRTFGLQAILLCIFTATEFLPQYAQAEDAKKDTPSSQQDSKAQKLLDQANETPFGSDSGEERRADVERIIASLKGLSDAQLEGVLTGTPDNHRNTSPFDYCLSEIVRRGGAHWEQVLKNRYAVLKAADANAEGRFLPNNRKLTVLTALRRVQKKHDPLIILVEGKATIEAKLGYLPELSALLTNLDVEGERVALRVGGDYRGASRHNKWRIQAIGSKGQPLPEKKEFDMGGIIHSETLEYAESLPLEIRIGSYLTIDQPGTYTLTVMFHPLMSIGLMSDVEGLICCQSIPIKLVVEPITIETTDAEQAKAAELIVQLPKEGKVKILGGGYADNVHDFMPPSSPAAQLKEMEWKAVPELIAAVNGNKLNPTQRAWALGLLFSITDQRSPMDAQGVIGPFEYRHSGWVTFGGGPGSGQSISRQSLSIDVGEIDPDAQMRFAEGWKPWIEKQYIKIEKEAGK